MSLQLPLTKAMTKGLVYPSFVHGASPWSPLDDIAALGLAHWWDASLESSLTLDGSSNISAWQDRIGGVTATQTASANRPRYNAADGCLDNTQSARWLNIPYIATGNTHKWAVHVMAADLSGATMSDGGLWAINGYSGAVGARQPMMGYTRASTLVNSYWDTGAGASSLSLTPPDDAWHLALTRLDGGVHKASVNGGSELVGTSVTLPASANATGRIGDFRWTTNSAGLVTYKVRHLLIGNAVLTPELRDKLVGWAAWDRGIASVLPSGHPYKSARPLAS